MSIGETYRIGMQWTNTNTGKTNVCALYLKQDTVAGFSVADIRTEVVLWWNTSLAAQPAMKTYFPANVELASVTLRKWDPLDPVIDIDSTGLPIAGTAGGDQISPQNALVVSLRTAQIGRSYRGRIFLPPMSESIIDTAGLISNAEADAIALQTSTFLNNLKSPGSGAATPVIWSRLLNSGSAITQVKVDERMRSQRRRQVRASAYRTSNV